MKRLDWKKKFLLNNLRCNQGVNSSEESCYIKRSGADVDRYTSR